MGYRSEVGLALTKHGVETLYARLDNPEVTDDLREHVLALLERADEHYVDSESGAEVWTWNWIKWYDTSPYCFSDVKFIADTINELEDDDYRFIRIGEEYDDTEIAGGFWENPFDLELTRGITLCAPA